MSEYDKVVWKPTAEGGKEGTLPLFEVLTVPGQTELWRKDKTIPLVDVVQGGCSSFLILFPLRRAKSDDSIYLESSL
jgi:hypothetical protein